MKHSFTAAVEYNNRIYFSSSELNGLFEYDFDLRETRLVSVFEREECKPNLHRVAYVYKNVAWFIPHSGRYIAKINLDTYSIDYIDVPFKENTNKGMQFFCGVKNGTLVACIPRDIDSIVIIDMAEDKIKLIPNTIVPSVEIPEGGCWRNNQLYLFCKNSRKVKILNPDTDQVVVKSFSPLSNYLSFLSNEKDIWATHADSEMISHFDNDCGNEQIFKLSSRGCFMGMLDMGSKIVVLPLINNTLVVFDKITHIADKLKVDCVDSGVVGNHSNRMEIVDSEKRKIITTHNNGYIIEILDSEHINKSYPIEWDEMQVRDLTIAYKERGMDRSIFSEIVIENGKDKELRTFINYLKQV